MLDYWPGSFSQQIAALQAMITSFYRHTYRVTLGVRTVSWFLVLFYLVASCRAFLPGICATQNAMDARNEAEPCEQLSTGLPSCCAARLAHPSTGDDSDDAPVTPQDAHCPFCTLVMSAAPVPCHVEAPVPLQPLFTPPLALASLESQDAPRGAFQNRAPPA